MSEKPKYYVCEICGHNHPWDWNGDCRDDANRFTDAQLDAKHGPLGYDLADMAERVSADGGGMMEAKLREALAAVQNVYGPGIDVRASSVQPLVVALLMGERRHCDTRQIAEALQEAILFMEAPPESLRHSPVSRGNLTKLLTEALNLWEGKGAAE